MDVARARTSARPSWLNVRTVAGVAVFVAAVIAGGRFLEAARTTHPAWVATRDLAPGAVLGQGDVGVVAVNLPAEVAARYPSGAASLDGMIVSRAVSEGSLIPRDALVPEASRIPGRALTIPVSPEHAVGGSLRPGDRIDVFATTGEGGVAVCTEVVAAGVELLEVVSGGGVVLQDASLAGITVAVTPAQAAAIAHALRTAEIDIAKVTDPTETSVPGSLCMEARR